MLSPKLRRKLLLKWAQAAPSAPASPASPASPGSPGSPASPATTTTPDSTTSGAKKNPSQPASSMLGSLGTGWPNWVPQINGIVSTVDAVIIAGTKQKFNFNDLYQNGFPSGADTDFPPPDPTGDVIKFGRQIYQYIMNNGKAFAGPLRGPDMRARVGALLRSQYLMKFQQINPAGPLGSSGAQLSKLRATIQSLLDSLPLT